MSGSLEPEAAVINATLLPDIFILHLAARVALQASRRAALRSRSLHAELVFSLSGSKHVSRMNSLIIPFLNLYRATYTFNDVLFIISYNGVIFLF